MKFLRNLKTAHKLLLLIMISILGLAAVGYTGYSYLLAGNESIDSMYKDRLIPIKLVNDTRTLIRNIDYLLADSLLTQDIAQKKANIAKIGELSIDISKNIEKYKERKLEPFEVETLESINKNLQTGISSIKEVAELTLENKNSQAYAVFTKNTKPPAEKLSEELIALAEFNAKTADDIKNNNDLEFVQAKFVFMSIILTAVIILAVSGWLIVRVIVIPLSLVVKGVEALGEGNLSESIPEKFLNANDELAQLGKSFTKANANIKNLIKNIAETSEQLSSSSQQLTASTEESAQAANSVAIAIMNVSQGAEKQLGITGKALETLTKISSDAEQISNNTNAVASTSDQTAHSADKGLQAVETAITQMAFIQKTVENLAKEITGLGVRSKEIGQIVETISGIAGQTNLLALNAAIEAARAGEQGRGFAVVAEEVRKLAEQSREAAKQISSLIGGIQEDTNKAVQAMEKGTREVKTGAELVDNAGEGFKEITALISLNSQQVKEISKAIIQLAKESQEVLVGAGEVHSLSENTSNQTQNVSTATEEQLTSLEEIAASSHILSKRAEDLQYIMKKFVI